MSFVAISPLAQSADKQLLFTRLGLNEQAHKLLLVSFCCCFTYCMISADREMVFRAKLKPQEIGSAEMRRISQTSQGWILQ